MHFGGSQGISREISGDLWGAAGGQIESQGRFRSSHGAFLAITAGFREVPGGLSTTEIPVILLKYP